MEDFANKLSAVIRCRQSYIAWKLTFDLGYSLVDRVGDRLTVRALEHHHDDHQAFLAVLCGNAGEYRNAELHACHIAYQNWNTFFGLNNDLLDVRRGLGLANTSNEHTLTIALKQATARIFVVVLQGRHNIVNGNSSGQHRLRRNDHLVLLHATVSGVHFRNAGHCAELWCDNPVLQLS